MNNVMKQYPNFSKKNAKKNIWDSVVFCWLFFQMTANNFLYRVVPDFVIPSFVMAIMPVIVAWIRIIFPFKRYIRPHSDVFIFVLCVLSMLLDASLGNKFLQYIAFSSSFFMLITSCIFIYTRESLESLFCNVNIVCFLSGGLVCLYAVAFTGSSYLTMENSYMAIGYALSLYVLVLFEYARVFHKKFEIIVAAGYSAVIFSFGNRGALLVVIIYLCLRLLVVREEKLTQKDILGAMALFLLAAGIIINFEGILNGLISAFQEAGISSRTFEKILNHSFSKSQGRNEIYEKAFEIIKAAPLDIKGPGYLTTVYINQRYINANAHNILLELLVEYGCILGPILFALILERCVVAIRLLRHNPTMANAMAFCLLLQAIIQLSFSSTFYSSNEFWLGLVLTGILSRRNNRATN